MAYPPFLRKDRSPGVAMPITRTPDANPGQEPQDQEDPGLVAAADAMIGAFESKDAKSLAKAFKDAFQILESQPHDEVEPMPEDES